jgi:polyphenol oxidase
MDGAPTPLRGTLATAGGVVGWAFTDAHLGDLGASVGDDDRLALEQSVAPLPWVMVHQVHGDGVLDLTGNQPLPVAATTGALADVEADAIVIDRPGVVVAVRSGDCAPLLLVGSGPVVAAVHAGWRGLVAGVVEAAVATMGVPVTEALLGPCIWPCCYAFGEADLARAEARFGPAVRGRTADGQLALDVPVAVDAALAAAGAPGATRVGGCTGCGVLPMFSHRVRAESGRQAGAVWIETAHV